MTSDAKTVDDYMLGVPEKRREAIQQLRQLCLEILVDFEEYMSYGMPSYSKDGIGGVAFANQKNYISLYVVKTGVINNNKDLLKGLSVGKCCIRYPSPAKMDFEVIKKLLKDSVQSTGPVC
jgi:uncharacterized protein YdhG (YjbR/CyaY superfamily)